MRISMFTHETFRLRPINEEDLGKILVWRNSERIRSCMFTDHIITLEEHKSWFEKQKCNEYSAYLMFDLEARPVGLVCFTDIDRKNGKTYWGFYLGEEGLPRGTGTALGWFALNYAFSELAVRKVCGEVLASNTSSICFHMNLGFSQEGRLVSHILKNGKPEDVVSFALFRDDWIKLREELAGKLFRKGMPTA